MPVKDAMPFLEECLKSIVQQTYVDWELIAVDDGSSDFSHEVLQNYSSQYYNIQVYRNTGKGIIDALRLAYQKSKGKWITRMDADDIMTPVRIQVQADQLTKHGQGNISIGLVQYFSANGLGDGYLKYQNWLNKLTRLGQNFTEIYKECVIPSPCWMLHRSDLEYIGAFDSNRYPEDYDLCFRMYEAKLIPISNKQVLHFWRDYPHRTSRTHDHYADNRFLDLKLDYFLKLDYNRKYPLLLWGAGKKGKLIAKKLNENDIPFRWICENPNKIGNTIYGQELESPKSQKTSLNAQFIIAVAGQSQNEIVKKIPSGSQAFYFC